jgi:hypothetical protein
MLRKLCTKKVSRDWVKNNSPIGSKALQVAQNLSLKETHVCFLDRWIAGKYRIKILKNLPIKIFGCAVIQETVLKQSLEEKESLKSS